MMLSLVLAATAASASPAAAAAASHKATLKTDLDAFKAWMAQQPEAISPGLFDGRVLTLDEQSAPRMLPWLRKYAARRN